MSIQKIQNALKKMKKDKKGQSIIELAFGTILVSVLLTAIFDFALIIQTKSETLMMARNGVRYLIMQGVDVGNPGRNEYLAKRTEDTIRGLYQMNHGTQYERSIVGLTKVEVKNTTRPEVIKDGNTGKNAVHAEVCEIVRPISVIFPKSGVEICSSYAGFHSSQFKRG